MARTNAQMAGEIINAMIERGDMAPSQVEMACEALAILNTKVGEEMAIFLLTSMIKGGELKNIDTFVDRVEDVCNAFISIELTISENTKGAKIDTFSSKAI
jgi:hypothetical protein